MNYIDQINRAIDHIEANLCGPLDLEAIAKRAGLSKWHFQRVFRAMVGDTVKEYVAKRRLSLAAMALVSTDMRVIDIALAHEFESHEVFSRAFKRAFGMTPSEFRRSGVE